MLRFDSIRKISKGGEMMKVLGMVCLLVAVACGASMGDTVTFDYYSGWAMVSAPCVPIDPTPWNEAGTGVFGTLDIDFAGGLIRWDAGTQQQIGWSQFAPESFGNVLLGDGYWLSQPASGTTSYTCVANGVPSNGVKTDMWVSLPGNQGDGLDAGGWHIIGTPFNDDICFSKEAGNLLGDNILVTDGTEVKTWGAAYEAGWVEDPMIGWDGATQSQTTTGYFFANDEYMRKGCAYWVLTKKDNLALIIPADQTTP